MKKILHILALALLFQTNISYSMQQNAIGTQESFISSRSVAFFMIGAMIPWCFVAYKVGFYSNVIKKKLHKIIWGKLHLTPEKLEKRVRAHEEQHSLSQDSANMDIYTACECGATERVKELLQDPNLDINKARSYREGCHERKETPLDIACKKQHPEIVKLLLSRTDIQINQQDDNGYTPLLWAYCAGRKYSHNGFQAQLLSINLDIVNILLANQAIDINHLTKNGESILSLACKDNNEKFIKQLLQDPRIKIDNNRALCAACENQNVEIVRLLLERNVNNCMNINEDNAIFTNPLLIISLRIRQYDRELKQKEWSNARQGIADKMMYFLLDETTSQKIQKIKMNCAQCVEIFTLLLKDPKINVDTEKDNITALHLCTSDHTLLSGLLARSTQFINKLASYNSLFNSHRGENYTPLHMAMMEGSLESVLLLIQHGANLSLKNNQGESPLQSLCSYNSTNQTNIALFRTLLERNLITTKNLDENHCLVKLIDEAQRNNDNTVPRLLLEYGANPNQQRDHRTNPSPLFAAAQNNLSLLNLCLDYYKGDYKQKNQCGETVLFTAFMYKRVKHFHHINFLKKLTAEQRKEYMLYELEAAAQYDQSSIKPWHRFFKDYSSEELKKNLDHFSLFLSKCIYFGNINLISPISSQLGTPAAHNEAENKSLLDLTYEKMQKQLSAHVDDRDNHLYKEVILHSFLRCVKDHEYGQLTEDLKVHYKLIQIYKDNPSDYYRSLDLPKKITYQQYMREMIQSEMHHNTGNKTGLCTIF